MVFCALLLALGAASCGGSSSSGTTTATGVSSTAATPTTSASTEDTVTQTATGSDFCASAKAQTAGLKQELKPLTNLKATPERLKATWAAIDKAYAGFISSAPSEIKPDLLVMYGAIQNLEKAYAQNDYNVMKAFPQFQSSFSSAKFQKAVHHLEAWGKANCPSLK